MTAMSDKIMKRVRAKGRGNWVCTPKDFLDFGSRASIDQALSRLAKSGDLRRIARGLYDFPRTDNIMKRLVPTNMDLVIAAIARRDGARMMEDGLVPANLLGLTNAVPGQLVWVTDGPTRTVKIGNRTAYLQHAPPRIMWWAGKPSAPVMMALLWLGPHIVSDNPKVTRTLGRVLPDRVKRDLVRNSAYLPPWAARTVPDIVAFPGDPQ